MQNLYLLIAISGLLLLSSCDPPQNIVFVNDSDQEAVVILKFGTTDSSSSYQHSFFDQEIQGDSMLIRVPKGETRNLNAGIGNWSDWAINDLGQSLDWIRIETSGREMLYTSSDAIHELLSKNRKGFWWKTEIELKIE